MITGDILEQNTEAIVNSVNEDFKFLGNVHVWTYKQQSKVLVVGESCHIRKGEILLNCEFHIAIKISLKTYPLPTLVHAKIIKW